MRDLQPILEVITDAVNPCVYVSQIYEITYEAKIENEILATFAEHNKTGGAL